MFEITINLSCELKRVFYGDDSDVENVWMKRCFDMIKMIFEKG